MLALPCLALLAVGASGLAQSVPSASPPTFTVAGLDSSSDGLSLTSAVYTARDATGKWTPHDALSPDNASAYELLDKPNMGLSNKVLWARFSLKNQGNEAIERVVQFRRSQSLRTVDAYLFAGNKLLDEWHVGSIHPISNRPLNTLDVVLPIALPPGEERTMVMRVDSGGVTMQVEPKLWTIESMLEQVQVQQVLLWTYYGLFAIMGLYHLVVYLAVRERSYLHFAVFALAGVLMDMCFEGPAQQFITPAYPEASLRWFLPSAFLMLGMQLTFTCSVLDARTYAPRLARTITWFAYAIFAAIPVLFMVSRFVGHIGFIAVSTLDLVLCLSAGFITMRRGYAPARIYLLSWVVFFACIGTMVLANNGVLPSNLFTDQIVLRLGSAFQIVFFSLVLAKRVNLLRDQVRETSERLVESQQERIAAQTEALAIKEEAAANLQRKVDERTRELHDNMRKLRRLFDSLAQGVFSFGHDLTIRGNWSVAAERIFDQPDLQGAHVNTILCERMAPWDPERQVLEQFLQQAFKVEVDDFTELCTLAPKEVTLHPDTPGERILLLEFRPVVDADSLSQVMCLATDVTEVRKSEAEYAALREEQEREITVLRNISVGASDVVRHLRETEQRYHEFAGLLGDGTTPLSEPLVEGMFQLAHSVKGDSALHDFLELEQTAEAIETQLASLRERIRQDGPVSCTATFGSLMAGLEDARTALEQTRLLVIKAAPAGSAVFDQTTVRQSLLDSVLNAASAPHTEIDTLLPMLHELAARPFGETVSRLERAVPTWAANRGKCAMLQAEGGAIDLPAHLVGPVATSLMHMTRNAIAHGVETAQEREESGKSATATIKVTCSKLETGFRITVEDDGRGIDVALLRSRAHAAGVETDGCSLLDLVCAAGVSTAKQADNLAGCGVGMSAVTEDLAAIGYHLQVDFNPGEGTRFEISPAESGSSHDDGTASGSYRARSAA